MGGGLNWSIFSSVWQNCQPVDRPPKVLKQWSDDCSQSALCCIMIRQTKPVPLRFALLFFICPVLPHFSLFILPGGFVFWQVVCKKYAQWINYCTFDKFFAMFMTFGWHEIHINSHIYWHDHSLSPNVANFHAEYIAWCIVPVLRAIYRVCLPVFSALSLGNI